MKKFLQNLAQCDKDLLRAKKIFGVIGTSSISPQANSKLRNVQKDGNKITFLIH